MPTVNANIAMRLGTTEQWEAATVPLLQGEWGMEITEDNERIFKVGDGESLWGDLPAFTGQPGEPGREVSLQVTATHIQWRLGDDAEWQDLIALEDLKGEPGPPGEVDRDTVGSFVEDHLTLHPIDGGVFT